jgi:hypothetical protein
MPDNNDYHLGEVAARYEGRGPGTISAGNGDKGGVSYGTYQLSTKEGTLGDFLKQSAYKTQFEDLTPESTAFNEKWRDLARTEPGFAQDQQDFIKKTHYDPVVAKLKKDGLDLTDRGAAVQEALWSTSVQARGLTPGIFEHGLEEKFGRGYKLSELTDKDIVSAVQDYKTAHNNTLFKRSPRQWPGLLDRASWEEEDLEALADGNPLPDRSQGRHSHRETSAKKDGLLREGQHGDAVSVVQQELHDLGYKDTKGNPLAADRDFGPSTTAAIKSFQQDHGLRVDGVVGKDTASALSSETSLLEKSQVPNALNAPDACSITRDSSLHDMFEAICSAAGKGDIAGMNAIGQAYAQSPEGQASLLMGAQANQMQTQMEAFAQMQIQMQAQPQVQRGPVR